MTTIAKKDENALSVNNELLDLINSEEYVDDLTAEDLEMPRIKIVQDQTSEYKNPTKKIEGLEVGDILNTLTKKFVKAKDKLLFVPCARRVVYLEFSKDRKLVNNFGTDSSVYDSIAPDDKLKRFTPNGGKINKMQEICAIIINLETNDFELAIISEQHYKLKAYNSLVKLTRQAPYASVFSLKTKTVSKDEDVWMGFDIAREFGLAELPSKGENKEELSQLAANIYKEAKAFSESFSEKNVSYDDLEEEVI